MHVIMAMNVLYTSTASYYHTGVVQQYIKSQKNILKNEEAYRDGIPQKQPNKVGTNDTTVPLRTPIPISFDIFQSGLMLVT